MKSKSIYFFCLSLIFTILAGSSLKCVAQETFTDLDEKIYITPQDLLICEEGLFLCQNEVYIRLESISFDNEGLFVKISKGREKIEPLKSPQCPNGHSIYHHKEDGGCNGCANWFCNFRCKCHFPWP